MEGGCSCLARGASSSHGSGEASPAAAGKGKKNRASSPVLVNEWREAAETGPGSAWTGEKKTKIESTIASEDLGDIALDDTDHCSGEVAHGEDQIEGLDWDKDKLRKEIDCCLGRLHDGPPDDCDDEGFWATYNEEEMRALNQRLALCRIRAHEEKYRELDDAALSELFPPSVLEENGYFELYEGRDWYFDPSYCEVARFQDYQRLMLHNNGEFEEYDYYRKTCSTPEGDQQFVQFWEKLSSKTKLFEWYMTNTSCEPIIRSMVLYYHALKIAEGLPHVYKTLIRSGYTEFVSTMSAEHTFRSFYADFLFEMLEMYDKQKMNFKEALEHVYNKGNCLMAFGCKTKFEDSLRPMEDMAQNCGVHELVMEATKEMVGGWFSFEDARCTSIHFTRLMSDLEAKFSFKM